MRRLLLLAVFSLGPYQLPAGAAETDAEMDGPALSKEASEILTRSMEFISSAPAFKVVGEGGNEEWQEDGQMLEFGADFALAIQRPAKANLRIESRDGATATLILDGESMSVSTVFKQTFFYDLTEQPGDVNTSLDHLSTELGVPRQLRSFLSKELTASLNKVTSGYFVGEAIIEGVKCDHLALRDDSRDVQVWIAQGAEPVPRRIVIRHRLAEGQPRVWVELTQWDLSPEPEDGTFTLSLPPQAERIEFFFGSPTRPVQ